MPGLVPKGWNGSEHPMVLGLVPKGWDGAGWGVQTSWQGSAAGHGGTDMLTGRHEPPLTLAPISFSFWFVRVSLCLCSVVVPSSCVSSVPF